MAENSSIEWTTNTMNFWIGCTEVSPGCDNCYARTLAQRYGWTTWGKGQPRIRTSPANWRRPYTWEKKVRENGERPMVFTNSLADFFDPEVDPQWRVDAWNVIRDTPHLTWQILTKRPNLIRRCLPDDWGDGWDNVWLGTSVEDQRNLWRAYKLNDVPARIRFLSMEPLLGPVRLGGSLFSGSPASWGYPISIHWIIVGAESGAGARPMDLDWVRAIRDEIAGLGIGLFLKQDAKNGRKIPTPELDGQRWVQFPSARPAVTA